MTETYTLSAAQLKAMAHPARLAMLENLGYRGALTATQLAELVDESPSNCSWHLRKLAEHGLVEHAETSSGRDRPWQLVFDSYRFAPEAATSPLPGVLAHRQTDRLLRAVSQAGGRPLAHHTNGTWLTADEARAIAVKLAELAELVPDAEARRADAATRPEGAELYEFVGWLAPVDDLR